MSKLFTTVVIAGITCFSVPARGEMGMMGREHMMMNMSMARHHFAMMNGIDPKYVSKKNPFSANAQSIDSGKKLFEKNCVRCHGLTGVGDGEDGKNLNPRPANIATASKMPMASDGYLYWTITEGGVPLGTGMPPFGGTLKEEEIWKIITYLRML